MVGFRLFQRHARWESNVDAYVDVELSAQERSKFERHTRTCPSCSARVREASALRRMLKEELTIHPVPRSFRITSAMLAESPAQVLPAPALWWPRLAQGVGGLAVAAFALLLVVDLNGASENSAPLQSASAEVADELPVARPAGSEPTDGAQERFSDGGDDMSGACTEDASPQPTLLVPQSAESGTFPYGNGQASGDDDGDFEASSKGATDPDTESTAADTGAGRDADAVAPNPEAIQSASAGTLSGADPQETADEARSTDGSDGRNVDGLLVAQVASAAIALAAAGTYLISRRKQEE